MVSRGIFDLLIEPISNGVEYTVIWNRFVPVGQTITINENKYVVLNEQYFTLITAPNSIFEKIGLQKVNGKFKNYAYVDKSKYDITIEKVFVFSSAKISFISLMDKSKFSWNFQHKFQFIQLSKINS
jgi:hypothetical protein